MTRSSSSYKTRDPEPQGMSREEGEGSTKETHMSDLVQLLLEDHKHWDEEIIEERRHRQRLEMPRRGEAAGEGKVRGDGLTKVSGRVVKAHSAEHW